VNVLRKFLGNKVRFVFERLTYNRMFAIVEIQKFIGGSNMAVNIYDIAYSLQNAFKEQPEFKNLQSLYSQVLADPSAKPLFMEFQNFQKTMQQKMYQGEPVTPEENAKGQEIVARVSQNPLIANLMQTEQRLNLVIQDVNKIVMNPLEEFYKSLLEL